MIDWIVRFSLKTATFNSIFGICLYWLPLVLCAFGYTVRTAKNIQKDKEERSRIEKKGEGYYEPTDTIGDLIGRSVITIIPIGNLWAALFDVSPEVFERLFEWIGKTFNQPLVPRRKNR